VELKVFTWGRISLNGLSEDEEIVRQRLARSSASAVSGVHFHHPAGTPSSPVMQILLLPFRSPSVPTPSPCLLSLHTWYEPQEWLYRLRSLPPIPRCSHQAFGPHPHPTLTSISTSTRPLVPRVQDVHRHHVPVRSRADRSSEGCPRTLQEPADRYAH